MAAPGNPSSDSELDLHREDRERGVARQRAPFAGFSEARARVQGDRRWVVRGCPQAETSEATLTGPAEHRLEQRAADAAPAPCGVDPHAADPSGIGTRPI